MIIDLRFLIVDWMGVGVDINLELQIRNHQSKSHLGNGSMQAAPLRGA